MINGISWDLYRSFLSVLNEGSLSAAARSLSSTQPTIGRHIDELEKALGLVLFTRSQAGLTPTEAAMALGGLVQSMANTAASLQRVASAHAGQVAGVVRLSASEVVGAEVLPPVIAALHASYPALRIELVLSNRLQDLLQREVDIAVRMVQPEQDQLLVRKVGQIELGLFATRSYLDRNGYPKSMADLRNHAVIAYDQETIFIRDVAKFLPGLSRQDFSFATDSNLAQMALIKAGAGIGICQNLLALRNPELCQVLDKAFNLKLDTWVSMHEDLRYSLRYRVVFDALVQGMQSYIEGRKSK